MKQELRLLLLLLIAQISLCASAYNFTVDGIYYQKTGDGLVAVTYNNGNDYSGNVVIPSSVKYDSNTYSVTTIGKRAFYDCDGLTSVTLPNSVTSIGDESCMYCGSLTSVTLGNSVTSIGSSAFEDCSGLTSVTIPNSVTSIGEGAFSDCSGLTSVAIGNSVTSIGNSAFLDCSSLTSVTIPNSVTFIDESAFEYCSNLAMVTIGNSVTSIGNSAFNGCSSLNSVTSLNKTPPKLPDSDSYNYYSPFDNTTYNNAKLLVPKSAVNAYKSAYKWAWFLNVEGIDESGVEGVEQQGVAVTARNGSLAVTGTDGTESIEVYNLSGHLVYRGTATQIPNPGSGLYIVRIASHTFKVAQ